MQSAFSLSNKKSVILKIRLDALPARSAPLFLGMVLAAFLLSFLSGCGYSGSAGALPVALTGSVYGGRLPVSGSLVQLYAAGTGGTGSAAQALLSEPVKTDSNGQFSIPATFGCPSPSSQLFVVATGGAPGPVSGGDNPVLRLATVLGSCSNLSSLGSISINEVTTVGSIWPIAQFMKSATDIGSTSADPAFPAAVSTIPEFINITQGTSPGTPTAVSSFTESAKLNSLADLLADCVDSAANSLESSTPCGQLFAMATPSGGSPPADTIAAALQIAQHPENNVESLFRLTSVAAPFQPLLTQAPGDWELSLTYTVAAPSISPATGTYASPQTVTIADTTPGSTIYYTLDGTVPTSASSLYHGPITLSASAIVQAIALLKGSQSGMATAVVTINTNPVAPSPSGLAFLQQPTNGQTAAALTPAVQVMVTDQTGNLVGTATNFITLSLPTRAGLTGTLTARARNGIATFSNLIVSNPGTYELSARSPALGFATSATFVISNPPSGVTAPAPTQLAFLQQPSNAFTGAKISPAVTVALEDDHGNTVSTATNAVTLALNGGSGLGGTLTATAQNGIATFNQLTMGIAGSGYTLTATSPGLASATSTSFRISAPVSTPAIPAQAADAFVDSVGVNVHFSYYGSVYSTQTQALETYLNQMGVRHVRDQMAWQGPSPSNPFYQVHNQLGALGIKTDYIVTSIDYLMSQVAAYPGLVNDMEAVEAANEWDNVGDANWVADITAQQTALFATIHGTPAIPNVTVVAPSLAQPQNAPQLGNVAAIADVSDLHAYFAGWNPGNVGTGGQNNPPYFMRWAQVNVPSKPVWVTETGYWGVQEAYYGGGGVSPDLMATYTVRSAFAWWMAGAARSYVYELADDNTTQFFGLIDANGTPKPAYYALSNLLNLLKDPGTSFTPGALSYSVSGASSQVQQLLFQKRDGSFYLALWVEAPGMNASTEENLTVPYQAVQITLGQFPSAVTSYQWSSTGTMSTSTLPAAQTIPVSVGPNLTILKIQ